MAATASPQRNGSHVDLTAEEFQRRLAAHGHGADEIQHLWTELSGAEAAPAEPTGSLGLGPVIAVYLGLLLVVVACAALVAVYWDSLGAWGVLALAVAYLAGYLVAGEALRHRDLAPPAEVLEAVAVAWVCLAAYAVEELAGLWPTDMDGVNGIPAAVTAVTIVGLAAACALLVLRASPLLLLPIAAGTAVLTLDLAELGFGAHLDDLSSLQVGSFVLPLGLSWIAVGLWLDATSRRPYATVAHWCGLALGGWAVMAMIPKTVPGFAVVGLLGAIALFFSAFVRHWSFTVIGAAGVLMATFASFDELGRLAPMAAAIVGLALIYLGLRWSRWRESVRVAVLARMPARGRELVERLAP
jgi:hypothetical protein